MLRTCSLLLVTLAACSESAAPNVDAASEVDALASVDANPDLVFDLIATFGPTTREFERAYFGVNANDATYYVETYIGGDGGCPSDTSATPAVTVTMSDVIAGSLSSVGSSTLFDFEGALLAKAPLTSTSNADFAIIYELPDQLVLNVNVVYDEGTVTGTLVASHCEILDGP